MKLYRIIVAGLISCLITTSIIAKLKVVSSTSDLAAIAREIGVDLVEVDYICPPEGNPHFVEAVPTQMIAVSRADIYLKIGMELDQWADNIIDGSRNRHLKIVDCSQGIDRLEVPTTKVNASLGDIHAQGNPHYWLNPANGIIIARDIADAFSQADAQNYNYYQENLNNFEEKLRSKIEEWKIEAASLKGIKIVTYHNSWPYFASAFSLDVVGFIEPFPGIEPTPSHIANLIEMIKEMDVRIIGKEPYFEGRTPRLIASATKAAVIDLPPSVGGAKGIETYFDLFDFLISKLNNNLKASEL